MLNQIRLEPNEGNHVELNEGRKAQEEVVGLGWKMLIESDGGKGTMVSITKHIICDANWGHLGAECPVCENHDKL